MSAALKRIALVGILAAIAGMAARPYAEDLVRSTLALHAIEPCCSLVNIEHETIALFERASPSVVEVTTITTSGGGSSTSSIKTGSGFFWDTSGSIVTNAHVVDDATVIRVWLPSGEPVEAETVGSAPTYDLAVIRPKEPLKVPSPIAIGTSNNLKVGQWVYALGSPFGLDQSLTTGVISALKRKLPTSNGREVGNIIQTNAAIYPGSSGGPLLDSSGRLIGVNTVAYSIAGSGSALGFAIPIDIVKDIVPNLISNGRIPVPGIGVVPGDDALGARLGIEGVIIARIRPGSPAERAVLRAMDASTESLGDVITAANGEPVRSIYDLTKQLEHTGIGRTIGLGINRNGNLIDVEVEIVDINRKS